MPFKKGESGNPEGRPKNSRNKTSKRMLEKLLEIIDKVGEEKGKDILEKFVERAYDSDQVLIAVNKKIIADRNFQTDKGDGSVEDTKVQIELVETPWSAREAMIEKNKPGLLNILKQLKNNKLNINEALGQIGEELLKNK